MHRRLPDEEILAGAESAAAEASAAVLRVFQDKTFSVSSKGEAGPLTTADLESNRILEMRLRALLPDAGWLSEESVDDPARLSCEDVWIVDPIDGTKEFVAGNSEFSVSAGLSRNGRPLLGVVAMPAEGVQIAGGPGGVRKNGRPAVLSRRETLEGSTILVSQTEYGRGTFKSLEADFNIRPMGSIARKLALLAGGEGDLVVSLYPKNDWDICGGTALVLSHPDALVTDLETRSLRTYNQADPKSFGLCAGNAGLVRKFHEYFLKKGLTLARKY